MKKEEERMGVGQPIDLRGRTKKFALRILKRYSSLLRTTQAQVLGKQLLRSGTSIGAQYREANLARSDAEFVRKVESTLQELEETSCRLELLIDSQIAAANGSGR